VNNQIKLILDKNCKNLLFIFVMSTKKFRWLVSFQRRLWNVF